MLHNVQLLRVLSAWLIVAFHAWPPGGTFIGLERESLRTLSLGTDVFMVVSAFVVLWVYDRKAAEPGRFFTDRLVRIAPLYWAATLGVAAAATVAPSLFNSTEATPATLVMSLFFIPYEKASGFIHPIVYVGWTINLVVLFCGLLWAVGRVRDPVRRKLALAGLIAGLMGLGLIETGFAPWDFYTSPLLANFLLGVALSLFWSRVDGPVQRLGAPAQAWTAAAGGAGVAVAFAAAIAGPYLWDDAPRLLMTGVPAVLLVVSVLALERTGLRATAKPVQAIAAAGYSIYLTHFVPARLAVEAIDRFGLDAPWEQGGVLIVAVAVATAGGLVVHHLVEKPLTGFTQRRVEAWRTRRPAPVATAQAAP